MLSKLTRGAAASKKCRAALSPPHPLQQVVRQGVAGQGAGGHDDLAVRQGGDLTLHDGDIGVAPDGVGDIGGKALPVHRQSAPGFYTGSVRRPDDEAPQAAQLLLEQSHRVLQPRPPQGVGAHQLREEGACMGGGHFFWLHLVEGNGDSPLRQLPGGLAPRQARADYGYIHLSSVLPIK